MSNEERDVVADAISQVIQALKGDPEVGYWCESDEQVHFILAVRCVTTYIEELIKIGAYEGALGGIAIDAHDLADPTRVVDPNALVRSYIAITMEALTDNVEMHLLEN